MIFGYKSEPQRIVCANCDAALSKESEGKVQFCPKCGNPLTMEAAMAFETTMKKEKVAILYEVLAEVEEGHQATQVIERFLGDMQNN